MEKPITMSADDIRDEKVKVMRCLRTIEPKDCVLGQYTAGGKVSLAAQSSADMWVGDVSSEPRLRPQSCTGSGAPCPELHIQ